MVYLIYSSIYPNENFYRTDFIEVTGIKLPEQVEFMYKYATFPDFFGDYTSISIIKVGKDFYDNLPYFLIKKGLKETKHKINTTEFDKALENTKKLKIIKEFSKEKNGGVYYYVGFLSDNKTIIVKRLSW